MDDALAVKVVERLDHLLRDALNLRLRQGPVVFEDFEEFALESQGGDGGGGLGKERIAGRRQVFG